MKPGENTGGVAAEGVISVGVVSDTHGGEASLRLAIERAGKVDCWLHLGDKVRDAALLKETGVPVYCVRGNCDFGVTEPTERIIELGGARIFMTHGHTYAVQYDRYSLFEQAEKLGCSLALYGHTHVSLTEAQGSIVALNPGSPSCPRNGRERSFAIIEIRNGEVYPRIVTL